MNTFQDGLQFPKNPKTNKSSTTRVAKNILAAALHDLDSELSQQIQQEPNWRRNYPKYFKELVYFGLQSKQNAVQIAKLGLNKAHQSFDFYRGHEKHAFHEIMALPRTVELKTVCFQGENLDQAPQWYVPYQGKKLQGDDLIQQLNDWQQRGIIEPSHADALKQVIAHPEWLDLSDRTMVLFGAASEAGPLTWLAKWKANIVAIDLPNEHVWQKILSTVQQGNAKLYAPCAVEIEENASIETLKTQLGANLLTQTPEIADWLMQRPENLDLAAIAYLDGEKHVRVALAMDYIMQYVSAKKANTTLMFMCTPTDVYAVPRAVVEAVMEKYVQRPLLQEKITKAVSFLSAKKFFAQNMQQFVQGENEHYGIADGLVLEQGPNYALAKRLQQWRAIVAHQAGQRVSINIAPSTTTHSVIKNPLLKAAFDGADLFDVEAFSPETTNALMAALWIYDLRSEDSVANPQSVLKNPLELIMHGANHGGLWRVPYLARTALPFAALYGFAKNKLKKR